MGIDVELWVEADPNPEYLNIAEEIYKSRTKCWYVSSWGDGHVLNLEEVGEFNTRNIVRVNSASRYFGAGYERGWWPEIYKAIRCLQELFPGYNVLYDGDSISPYDFYEGTTPWKPIVTEKELSENWVLWNNGPYGELEKDPTEELWSLYG